MASFVLSLFPLDVLDEIWDLIESVSEGFLTYSSIVLMFCGRISVVTPGSMTILFLCVRTRAEAM